MQASIVLYPFTLSTDAEVAADLLLQHVSYHLQLGFAKVVQYTQARPCNAERERTRLSSPGVPLQPSFSKPVAGHARMMLAPAEPAWPPVRLWQLRAAQSLHL